MDNGANNGVRITMTHTDFLRQYFFYIFLAATSQIQIKTKAFATLNFNLSEAFAHYFRYFIGANALRRRSQYY